METSHSHGLSAVHRGGFSVGVLGCALRTGARGTANRPSRELAEFDEARRNASPVQLEDELGDLLFVRQPGHSSNWRMGSEFGDNLPTSRA